MFLESSCHRRPNFTCVRNAVNPSRRLAGSEILSKYSSSPPIPTASQNDFVIGTVNLIKDVDTLHRGQKILPFFFMDQSSFLVHSNHTSSDPVPFYCSSFFYQRDVFISDNNASYCRT